jgi:hypothetical protein
MRALGGSAVGRIKRRNTQAGGIAMFQARAARKNEGYLVHAVEVRAHFGR